MLLSDALEVAIGLTFVFLVMSLALSAVVEYLETKFKARSIGLHQGVVELLDDPGRKGSGAAAAKAVYSHPLIQGLHIGDYDSAVKDRKLPSYLPSRNFAQALIDQVLAGQVNAAPGNATLPEQAPLGDRLLLAAERIENEQLRRALLQAVKIGSNDAERITSHLEGWFNAAMERVSGRYKRRSQHWLLGLGLVAAVLLNVNALTIADALTQDATLRRVLVAQAEGSAAAARQVAAAASQPEQIIQQFAQIEQIGLPIGWSRHAKERLTRPLDGTGWSQFLGGLTIVCGYVLTALAASLGAPFWFDLLNRLIVVRAAVKPRDKPEQAPDPAAAAKAKAAAVAVALRPVMAAGSAAAPIDRDIYAEAPGVDDKPFEEWH